MDRFMVPGTVKQGYLTKSPPLEGSTAVFKGWKKRWVILYSSQRELFLQYYENEESARGSSPPKSTVSLKFCEKVDVDLEHSTYKNVFAIYLPERTYYFSAPSHYEMTEWGDTIRSFLSAKKEENDANLRHQIAATMPSSGRTGGYPSAPFSSSYGTSPFGNNLTMGSGTYGLAGSGHYGLAGSGTYGLAGSGHYGNSPYGTYSLSTLPPAPVSPGHYGSLSHSPKEIQSRDLPPIPTETTPTTNSLKLIDDQAPPVPPRHHSNFYTTTPTR